MDGLTPLRFVAAAMIVAGHGASDVGIELDPVFPYVMKSAIACFFVLPGLILRYNHPALPGRSAVAGFYVLRFARI